MNTSLPTARTGNVSLFLAAAAFAAEFSSVARSMKIVSFRIYKEKIRGRLDQFTNIEHAPQPSRLRKFANIFLNSIAVNIRWIVRFVLQEPSPVTIEAHHL